MESGEFGVGELGRRIEGGNADADAGIRPGSLMKRQAELHERTPEREGPNDFQ